MDTNGTDRRVNEYYNNKRIRRYLINAGLINRHGDIIPPPSYEIILRGGVKRSAIEKERKREAFIRNEFDFVVKRSRVQKIRESRHPQRRATSNNTIDIIERPKTGNTRALSPIIRKRSSIRAKSAHHSPKNAKNQFIRRPTTTKQVSNDDYCKVTMIYYGSQSAMEYENHWAHPNGDEIIIMQQHCGGENLIVFKGFVKSNETFTFESRRHRDYPFALALYVNGLIDSRISVCCEYKHKHNVRLGSKSGLFGIYDVQNSLPCRNCRFEKRRKKILTTSLTTVNSSDNQSPVPPRISSFNRFRPSHLLRTPSPPSEDDKKLTKSEINRSSNVAQASGSPKRISLASSQNDDKLDESHVDEPKNNSTSTRNKQDEKSNTPDRQPIKKTKDNHGKVSRVSAVTSKQVAPPSPMVSVKAEDTNLPLTRKKSDIETSSKRSSISSSESRPLPNKNDKRSSPRISERSHSSLSTISVKNEIISHKTIERKLMTSSSDTVTPRHSPSIFSSDDEDDIRKPKIVTRRSDADETSSSSTSTTSRSSLQVKPLTNENVSSSPNLLLSTRKDNNADVSFLSHTSIKSESSSIVSLEDDDHSSNRVTRQINVDNTSSSSRSKISGSSSKHKDDRESIKKNNDTDSSSSSSRQENDDHSSSLHNRNQEKVRSPPLSSGRSDDSQPPIKNDFKSRRSSSSSSSSTETVKINDIDTHTELKTPTEIENDSNSKLTSKKKRYDENKPDINEDEPSVPKVEKRPVRRYRPMENIITVWLDATVDNPDNDTLISKNELRQVSRTIRTFSEPEKCVQFIEEIKNEKIFLIVSGRLSEDILPQIDKYSQLAVVYIYCQESSAYEHLTDTYPKIKGIFTDIRTICEHLKKDSKQWDNDLNTFQTIELIQNNELNSEQLLFIQNELYKEYLLEIEYDNDAKQDLIEYCQNLYAENEKELELINQFEQNYNSNDALYWYTKDCFAYHMLNRAIRMKDINILFQMGFFLRDINQQLEKLYSTTIHRSTLTVFRGQGMKLEYFEELKQNQGGLLSFNGFLSTSIKQNIAYEFAQQSLSNGFPIAVLFRMKIDPTNTSTPFATLENLSSNRSEYEILFSFKTLFRIESIEKMENNLWQIDLTLINEKENQTFHYIQIEQEKRNHLINYEKLGELLIEMNEFDKAKDLYEINLPTISDPKYTYAYNQLALINIKTNNYNQALLYYNLSLQTTSKETLTDYVTISNIHNQIGKIFYQQNKFREALEKFQYALNIQLEHLSSKHPSLVNTYDLLAMIYAENNDYQKSHEYREKQLEIQEELPGFNQSDVAETHFKIGICLENLDRLNEAIDHVQQSVDITRLNDPELDNRQATLDRIREQLE